MPSLRVSAGLLLYRLRLQSVEVLLAHPGGPFFKNKDDGAWTIPKGEIPEGEEALATALREFEEETGWRVDPAGEFVPLGAVRQKSGKEVHAWAVEGDIPANHVFRSNTFALEWPPRSGRFQQFPEIDRAEFFPIDRARIKINPAQLPLLDRFAAVRNGG